MQRCMHTASLLGFMLFVRQVAAQNDATTRYIFLFGDSYSSTNFNASQELPSQQNPFGNPPYPGVTSANGSNWIDTVVYNNASRPHPLCYDFAFPGALVTRLPNDKPPNEYRAFEDQVPLWQETVKSLSWDVNNSIMISWFGINDSGLNVALGLGPPDPKRAFADIAKLYVKQLDVFYQSGGRAFMVFLVPPIWRTPVALMGGSSAAVQKSVGMFNTALTKQVYAFQTSHSGAQVSIFDPAPAFNDVLDNPARYGAPDATCTNVNRTTPDCLWATTPHPTTALHRVLGDAAHDQLQALGFYRNEFTASVPKPVDSGASSIPFWAGWIWIPIAMAYFRGSW